MKKKKVYLTLQNGDVFEGYRFGADGSVIGELVFSTGMVGYVENLTDPSNLGQLVVCTFPLIGNYGVMPVDAESKKAWVSALIVREYCETPSNFRCEETLDAYLKEQGVVGIYGVDTRQLTKILREEGVMNAKISDRSALEDMDDIIEYQVRDAVKTVAPTEKEVFGEVTAEYTIVLWNFGAKKSTVCDFVKQGCRVISMPSSATAEEILAEKPDGIVIADGPGDPLENTAAIEALKKLLGKKPIFGIGLGHQLVALALGAETAKQKYGHRGGNQPVRCIESGRVYISTQNHGYVVLDDTLKAGKVSFVNVNDGTCEGIEYDELHAFTTQFSPVSCNNGNVVNPLYEKFFALMKKEKENA
ncbi:MAG: carbamoyl phosphate synthase small subunit [Clostridia bacterium]|nr:carbamoyl phosphate synthase small subunit [Clostridia bacterium]